MRPSLQLVQTEFMHRWVPGHTRPHAPQFRESERVSAHKPRQVVSPSLHALLLQRPFVHSEPVGQVNPHMPQFPGLLIVLIQIPPQHCSVG